MTDERYMRMVAEELDDPNARDCGKCANCLEAFFSEEIDLVRR